MNFFQQLAGLELVGDLKIVIKNVDGKMVVSLLLENEKCGDDARKQIRPMLLRGTAEELDADFFATVGQPLQVTSGLMVDMEAYMKHLDTVKKQSQMGKATAPPTPAKPTVDPKTVAYDNAMKKVKELVDGKKYKDALAKLPDVKDYADKKTIIDARKQWLMQMMIDGGGMFPQPYPEEVAEPVATPPPVAAVEAQASAEEEEAEQEEEMETEEVNAD